MVLLNKLMLFGVCIFLQYFSSSASTDFTTELDKLREYFGELKENMNLNVDPCEDFWEYSTKSSIKNITYGTRRQKIFDIFTKTEPRGNTEVQVRNLITSWQKAEKNNLEVIATQIDFLGKHYNWTETTSDSYTIKDVAKLLGELCAANNAFIIEFSPSEREFTLPRDFRSEIYREEGGLLLSSDDVTGAEKSQIIDDMRETLYEFTDYRVTRPKVYTIKEIKENIPDFEWDEFFQPIYEAYNITENEAASLIHFDLSLEMLKGVINFIKSTNRKQLVQYMVIRYGDLLNRFPLEIDHALIFSKYLYENLSQEDIWQFEYMLNHHTKTKEEYRNSLKISNEYVNFDLRYAIEILSNPDKYLPEQYMDNLLGEEEMDPNKYFKNIYNFIRSLYRNKFTQSLNMLPSETKKFLNFIESYNDYNFDIFSAVPNKPKIQYFVHFLTRIWYKWFDSNQQLKKFHSISMCLPEYAYVSVRFINMYSTTKMAYLEFVRFLNSDLEAREAEKELLKEFGIGDYTQVFFIALAQNSNGVFSAYFKDEKSVLERFDGISKAFNCPIDSPVNSKSNFTTCLLASECLPAQQNLELLPFKLPYCDPQ